MATPLAVTHQFAAPPAAVYALLTDRTFLEKRLRDTGGLDPAVVDLSVADGTATIVTRQSIPASVLPPMVSAVLSGDPVTERTEHWTADGNGYRADLAVVIKGAPANLSGTMTLLPAGAGSALSVAAEAVVPIPLFGAKIESMVVEQLATILDREAVFTSTEEPVGATVRFHLWTGEVPGCA